LQKLFLTENIFRHRISSFGGGARRRNRSGLTIIDLLVLMQQTAKHFLTENIFRHRISSFGGGARKAEEEWVWINYH